MLLAALREPVEVQVIGGNSHALDIFLTVIGPLLIAGAAVFAARLAAKTANRRQQEQLEHDLEVRREEDVRDVLDDAVANVYEVSKAIAEAEAHIEELESQRDAAEGNTGSQSERELVKARFSNHRRATDEAVDKAYGVLVEVVPKGIRVALRLGDKHQISEAHSAFVPASKEKLDILAKGTQRNRTREEKERTEAANQTGAAAYRDFLNACERVIRQGLDSSSDSYPRWPGK
jgi:hypothetical protein